MSLRRSSPRLRAIVRSDPSGKQAVFTPRLTRVDTSETFTPRLTRGDTSETRLKSKGKLDTKSNYSTLKCPGRNKTLVQREPPQSKVRNGDEAKSDHKSTSRKRGFMSQTCRIRKPSAGVREMPLRSTSLRQKKLSSEIERETSTSTSCPKKTKIGKGVSLTEEKKSVKVASIDSSKQKEDLGKGKKLKTVHVDTIDLSKVDLAQNDITADDTSTSCTTGLNVKRKRGRTPKSGITTGASSTSCTTGLNVERKRGRSLKSDVTASDTSTACTKRLNIKRKRGRPLKSTTSRKRVKLSSACSCDGESKLSISEYTTAVHVRSDEVIDLTCCDESVGDDEDIDAAIFVPCSLTSSNLTQTYNTHSLSETGEDSNQDMFCNEDPLFQLDDSTHTHTCIYSDNLQQTSALHSGEFVTMAQLFDFTTRIETSFRDPGEDKLTGPVIPREQYPGVALQDGGVKFVLRASPLTSVLHLMKSNEKSFNILSKYSIQNGLDRSAQALISTSCGTDLEDITIPSLKRSKNVNLQPLFDAAQPAEAQTQSRDDSVVENFVSPTDEELLQPSTPQQKTMRRLARQKQLEEMRIREAALSREERLLRRKGVLPSSGSSGQSSSAAKRISWKDETDLVEMFIYSPVKDDDDDTISLHSDDTENCLGSDNT